MSWSDTYVGLPYQPFGRSRQGCDCWGLACIAYLEQLNIALPDYLGYSSVDERAEIAALVAGATASPLWRAVSAPQPLDILVFRVGRLDCHIGLYAQPGLMLHAAEGRASVLERYTTGVWSSRLTGSYRHADRSWGAT